MIPINVDRNVSARDYDTDHTNGWLRITSWFHTFQGEGPFAGRPAIFIRLAGCNIGAKQDCPWCDTNFQFDAAERMDVLGVLALKQRYPQTKLIVVTGGEPLLQWRTLRPIMESLQGHTAFDGVLWQFETNGLLLRQEHLDEVRGEFVHFVVSPKIPHNTGVYRPLGGLRLFVPRVGPPLLSLKYVVEANPTSPYVSVPADAVTCARSGVPVYVSGMTVYRRAPVPGELASAWDDSLIDQQATRKNYSHAAHLALKLGLTVSYQMHLFGDVE